MRNALPLIFSPHSPFPISQLPNCEQYGGQSTVLYLSSRVVTFTHEILIRCLPSPPRGTTFSNTPAADPHGASRPLGEVRCGVIRKNRKRRKSRHRSRKIFQRISRR